MPGNGKKVDEEEPLAQAVENLRMSRRGIYHIDVDSLMRGTPLVRKIGDGIYQVDFTNFPRF
jgi:hypothetical protein